MVEMSEVPDFAFCLGVRKLATLEDNLRRLITDEQQRKITVLGRQPVMYHMDCEEAYVFLTLRIGSYWTRCTRRVNNLPFAPLSSGPCTRGGILFHSRTASRHDTLMEWSGSRAMFACVR